MNITNVTFTWNHFFHSGDEVIHQSQHGGQPRVFLEFVYNPIDDKLFDWLRACPSGEVGGGDWSRIWAVSCRVCLPR